ncbi:hypothetical protein M569_03422 [Genlisea aurea]|uniref:PPM-type phosphatase domain-containing protein n=1 Tax=Genlisea aurea TaxID=192259 RepID=S8EFI9_9LAMI|nr:hypothetical protein M569_03422 [Genlisea aurea]
MKLFQSPCFVKALGSYLKGEKERIQRCKGRVFALKDEPDVARVWLPKNDSPGLAMARAFGDFCLKDFGLISMPEISYRCLTDKDEFVVLATDGVWDVLSNEEVVGIVSRCPHPSRAAETLVSCAIKSWRSKYPTSKIDDCAAVCLFLLDSKSKGTPANDDEIIITQSPPRPLSDLDGQQPLLPPRRS